MIREITEHFPSYATLHQATVTFEEMGERTITATVKIDGDIVPDFSSTEWYLVYKGEKFVLDSHAPQMRKDATTRCSLADLTFTSFPISELKRYFFLELTSVSAGTMIADKYVASLRLNASDFVAAFNNVLNYYFDGKFTIVLESGSDLDNTVKDVELDYTYLWDALANIYDVYGLTWSAAEKDGIWTITVNNSVNQITNHIFRYGYEGGLTRIERQLEDADIYNQLLGRGGETNIPYRYFKAIDTNNPDWTADPDAIPELSNVYFERLLDINFRWYIRGWVKNPNRDTSKDDGYTLPDYSVSDVPAAYLWAYNKGLTDEKFLPIEYVQDEESIQEYGVRQGKLEDDDDIYPTIQGAEIDGLGRADEIVAISEIVDEDEENPTVITKTGNATTLVNSAKISQLFTSTQYEKTVTYIHQLNSSARTEIAVDNGYVGQLDYNYSIIDQPKPGEESVVVKSAKLTAVSIKTGEEYPVSAIPGGDTYYLKATLVLELADDSYLTNSYKDFDFIFGFTDIKLTETILPANSSALSFNVWIKNVFQTTQGATETDAEYAARVWEPILGDRLGDEAKVMFSDGWMSASSDYEFTIIAWPEVDRTKSIDGVSSEWKLTLQKSDAEYETTGKYIPSETGAQPVAGDHFYFIGIDMPWSYVEMAEEKLNKTKQDSLDSKAYANPTWAIEFDNVRISTLEGEETETLFNQLAVGTVLQISDPRLSNGDVLLLAIRTLTVTWREGTKMRPEVSVVLSENVLERTSYSSQISPEAIYANVNKIVNQAVATVAKSYLSKQRTDTAQGKIRMSAGTSFGDFATGLTGTGGNIDSGGNAEMDTLSLRKWLEVPELRYNRISINIGNSWRAPGGGIIERVEQDYDSDGNALGTGTIYLHLEDGEQGQVALDDICQGIYHDGITESENATADMDDGIGNFKFTGFYTVYFRVTEILASDNHAFRYAIRPISDNWTESHHPCAAMHFVTYGNFTDATRQTSRYSTRTYERYLRDVTDWEFTSANIGAQFGDLSNLSVFGLDMSGYSAYLNNIYFSGVIKEVEDLPYRMEIDTNGDTTLAWGESLTINCTVWKGWTEATDKVVSWSIVRDTGNAMEDAAWLLLDKVKAFDGSFTIEHTSSHSDLASVGVSTLFTITATLSDGSTSNGTITI